MEIVVLVKPVPEAETRLRPNAAGTELDPDGVKFVLAGYDESAVEQALLLREATPGSQVRAVSFGPAPRTEEVLRSALALGCDAATWLESAPDLSPDPLLVARALALGLADRPRDLLLLGKQAGDDESGIVPSALGELFGWPEFGYVADLRFDASANKFSFDRPTDAGIERWEVPPPVVIGLQQAWNDPRTAKLPNILKSRRATIDKVPWSALSSALEPRRPNAARPTRFRLPPPRTGARMIAYQSPEEAATELVRVLREEAKVFP